MSIFHSSNGDIWDLDTGEVIEDHVEDHQPFSEDGDMRCETCERPWPCPRVKLAASHAGETGV